MNRGMCIYISPASSDDLTHGKGSRGPTVVEFSLPPRVAVGGYGSIQGMTDHQVSTRFPRVLRARSSMALRDEEAICISENKRTGQATVLDLLGLLGLARWETLLLIFG
jgi:hypothetical protein